MPEKYRALDWLARRHAGEAVSLIAHRAGVSKAAVTRATKDYGPFSRPTHYRHGSRLTRDELDERSRRWVAARRAGRLVADIAREENVSRKLVELNTQDHGPFPDPGVIEQWVADRHKGRTLPSIADDYAVRVNVVRRLTRPYGPFPGPGGRLPEGVVGVNGVARMAGVSSPTVVRWRVTGRLPDPDFTTAHGRDVWLPTTIAAWLETAAFLEVCPTCGARCLSLGHHVSAVHGP